MAMRCYDRVIYDFSCYDSENNWEVSWIWALMLNHPTHTPIQAPFSSPQMTNIFGLNQAYTQLTLKLQGWF